MTHRLRLTPKPLIASASAIVLVLAAVGCSSPSDEDAESVSSALSAPSGLPAGSASPATTAEGAMRTRPPTGVVAVTGGAIRGTLFGDVATYLGIPFAESTAGARRWRAPVPKAPWAGVREVNTHPSACPQLEDVTGEGVAPGTTRFIGSEDCLALNVWAPTADGSTKARPVMVFIHGGGFRRGSATYGMPELPLYDGEALARATGHVVVVLQYRVGTLGFLAHPGTADGASVGNFGLLDQQLGLRWVRDNAARFGGSPSNVTIFGESAGAMSVCAHMAAPSSQGLFHRAIMQSGWCPAASKSEAFAMGTPLVAEIGCDPNAASADVRRCLERADAERVTRTQPAPSPRKFPPTGGLGPVVDGSFLREAAEATLARGPSVPLIIGNNREDMPALVFEGTRDEYKAAIAAITPPENRARVEATYSPLVYGSYANALGALGTDTTFTCAARRIARHFDKPEGARAYHFVFPFPSIVPVPAFHGIDIIYLFQHGSSLGKALENPIVERLLATAWGSFASSGVPALNGLQTWRPTSSLFEPTMVLSTIPTVSYGFRNTECDVLERAGVTMN